MSGVETRFKEAAAAALDPDLLAIVLRVGAYARSKSVRCFLIGGAVRDVLLGRQTCDIDLLVECDATALAQELRDGWNEIVPGTPAPERAEKYVRYGTAKLEFGTPLVPGVTRLDFASCREERYPIPAGAPEVRYPVTVERDLGRRDYSVNAMAAEVSDPALPLVDPFHGEDDLGKRMLRILHPQSFVDDPARIIRGLRFMTRFGFVLEGETENAFRAALEQKLVSRLPVQRRFDELRKALGEPHLDPLLEKLEESGILRELHPDIRAGAAERAKVSALRGDDPELERGLAVFAILLAPLQESARKELLRGAGLPKRVQQTIAARAAAART